METKTKKLLILLVIAGIAVSSYLSYIKLTGNELSCNLGQCSEVQNSKYSELFGIPVAVFGLTFYMALLMALLLKKGKLVKFLVGWGVLYSTFLTLVELLVIGAICGYCMLSFAIIILISLLVFRSENNAVSSS